MGGNEVLIHAHRLVVGEEETPEADQGCPLLQLEFSCQESTRRDLFKAQNPRSWNHATTLHFLTVGRQFHLKIQLWFAYEGTKPNDPFNDFLTYKRINGLTHRHPGESKTFG